MTDALGATNTPLATSGLCEDKKDKEGQHFLLSELFWSNRQNQTSPATKIPKNISTATSPRDIYSVIAWTHSFVGKYPNEPHLF
jgi:hypothetical protein